METHLGQRLLSHVVM